MLITDQVATAPCTDPIASATPTFEAKPLKENTAGCEFLTGYPLNRICG